MRAMAVTILLLAGCGGSSSALIAATDAGPEGEVAPDAGAVDAVAPDTAPGEAGPTRSYLLASTGAQGLPGQVPFIQLTPANLATDVDVVSVHQDFYGVPWDAFEAGQPPPPEWTAVMDALVASATGKEVFLTLQLAGGKGRQSLADKAVVTSGVLTTQGDWAAHCYDFASASDGPALEAAYLAYVTWMVQKFQPRYVNVAVELNLFAAGCPSAWNGMVDVERAAYDAAKAAKPDVVAFPSIQIDVLYGYSGCASGNRQACYDANYALLANLKRDRFAVSTYPYLQSGILTVSDVPSDWFTRGGDRGGERTVVAETGWSAVDIVGMLNGSCITAIASDGVEQASYFDLLTTEAQQHGMDLVTWWSNRDFEPDGVVSHCCPYDAAWCALIDEVRAAAGTDPTQQLLAEATVKIWGAMGVRQYDGTPRSPIFDHWRAALALPAAPAP